MNAHRKHVWFIVILVAGYIALQLIADVAAAKIVEISGYTFPAGTFVFALTFTWRDMLHKRLGKEWARAAIVTAAGCNLFMVGYFTWIIDLPVPVFWPNQAAFEATLGIVWRIALASIVAELVSELADTEVYHILIDRIPERHQWARVLGSNLVSLPLDSLVFTTLAFGGDLPVHALWNLAKGQIVFKAIVTVISLPAIYTIPKREGPVELDLVFAGD